MSAHEFYPTQLHILYVPEVDLRMPVVILSGDRVVVRDWSSSRTGIRVKVDGHWFVINAIERDGTSSITLHLPGLREAQEKVYSGNNTTTKEESMNNDCFESNNPVIFKFGTKIRAVHKHDPQNVIVGVLTETLRRQSAAAYVKIGQGEGTGARLTVSEWTIEEELPELTQGVYITKSRRVYYVNSDESILTVVMQGGESKPGRSGLTRRDFRRALQTGEIKKADF